MSEQANFQPILKPRHVNFIALGGIIGSSYFLGTGYVLNAVGPFAFLAYAFGAIISFLTMACLAELSVAMPTSGSFVTYAEKFISPTWACGVGWSYWVSWIVYIPSECVAGGILMHNFMPGISIYLWSILFGLLVTWANLIRVKTFGEIEFWLSLVKIALLAAFSVLAVLIFSGLVGEHGEHSGQYLFRDGGLFPNGMTIFFINMIILLSNFQGAEVIGLSAAESENPEKTIPDALKKITFRITALYLIPTLLLALIFPWQDAGLTESVFSVALQRYGLSSFANIFTFLIITGALSCANGGLYAAARSLHALASSNMGPKILKKLNKEGVPTNAALATLAIVWLLLLVTYFIPADVLYTNLLVISGVTGSMCWISICYSQLRFRKAQTLEEGSRGYQVALFPYLTYLAIALQLFCLGIVAWSADLRQALYLGIPAVVLPMLLFRLFRTITPIV